MLGDAKVGHFGADGEVCRSNLGQQGLIFSVK